MLRILVPLAYNDPETEAKLARVEAAATAFGWRGEHPDLKIIDTGTALVAVQERFGRDLKAWADYAGAGTVSDGPSFHLLVLVDDVLSMYTGHMVRAALNVGRPLLHVDGRRVSDVRMIDPSARFPKWTWS